MTMAVALSVTPDRPFVCLYVTPSDVRSLSQIVSIRILAILFDTIMSSSSSIMVHIAPCLQELWPFVYEKSPFETMSAL